MRWLNFWTIGEQSAVIQGPTLVFWAQVELDKWNLTICACHVDLSPSTPASFKSIDKWQLVKLNRQFNLRGEPPKITCASCPKNPSQGSRGGQVTVMAKKMVKIDHFWIFLFNFFWWNDVLGIILRCSPDRIQLRLGSVAAVLVDSPQQSVVSMWGETCLLLLTVQTHRKVKCVQTGVWVASSHGLLFGGSDRGFVCRIFLWAYSSWGQWHVSQGEYASRYGGDQQVVCIAYESIISYNTYVKSTPSWAVKLSTENQYKWLEIIIDLPIGSPKTALSL